MPTTRNFLQEAQAHYEAASAVMDLIDAAETEEDFDNISEILVIKAGAHLAMGLLAGFIAIGKRTGAR